MNRKLFTVAATAAATAAVGGVAAAASAPTTITGRTTNIRQTSAVLQGSVNPNGASTTYYFQWGLTTSYGSSTTLNTSLVLSHSQALSGLASATLYHYRVKSKDAAANLATSADFTFTTLDGVAPIISAVSASGITASGATLTWTTNEAADSQVEIGRAHV